GGNTDFYNMLERERLVSKKISKTDAVRSQLGHDLPADAVHIGPSDYVPWLADRKWAHIRLEGRGFGDQPINVELKLEVWDSPNSAGVVIDAIRACKIALDRGLKGALRAPSAWLMKSPPEQWPDDVVIVVDARSLPEAQAYAARLVGELRARAVPLLRLTYRIDPKQFEGRALLYLSKERLTEIRDKIFDYQEFMEEFAARPTLDQLVEGIGVQIANGFVTGFFDLGLTDKI